MLTTFYFADVGQIKPHETALNLGKPMNRFFVMKKIGPGLEQVYLDFVSSYDIANSIAQRINATNPLP